MTLPGVMSRQTPVSITAVASLSIPVPSAQVPRPMQRGFDAEQVLTPVAERLGTDVDRLKAQLQQGTSLATIATAKGITRDDLLEMVKTGLAKTEAARAQFGLPSAANRRSLSLDRAAIAIADGDVLPLPTVANAADLAATGKDAGGMFGNRRPVTKKVKNDQAALADTSTLLKLAPDEVSQRLRSGTSLRQLATDQDVDFRALMDVIRAGMLYDAVA